MFFFSCSVPESVLNLKAGYNITCPPCGGIWFWCRLIGDTYATTLVVLCNLYNGHEPMVREVEVVGHRWRLPYNGSVLHREALMKPCKNSTPYRAVRAFMIEEENGKTPRPLVSRGRVHDAISGVIDSQAGVILAPIYLLLVPLVTTVVTTSIAALRDRQVPHSQLVLDQMCGHCKAPGIPDAHSRNTLRFAICSSK